MIFVVKSHFNRPQDEATRAAHREWMHVKYHAGQFLISGLLFEEGEKSGYILVRANSRAEVEELMSTDPVVVDGSVDISIVEFEPHVRLDNLTTALGDLVVLEGAAPAH